MINPILIHINRKYHVELDSILSVTQKRWGSIWVAFTDPKTKQKKIAIAKQGLVNLLTVINTTRIMRGQKAILAIIEK
jgi:hypothetical protein